jgi:hypothetical protein
VHSSSHVLRCSLHAEGEYAEGRGSDERVKMMFEMSCVSVSNFVMNRLCTKVTLTNKLLLPTLSHTSFLCPYCLFFYIKIYA